MGIIRLVLALAVFNSHFTTMDFPIVGGHEAVLAFFAISGFYMALVLDTAYPSVRAFYTGRFLTLYPIYAFALCLSVALLLSMDVHPMTTPDGLRELLANPVGFLIMSWTSLCVVGQELLFTLTQATDGTIHFSSSGHNMIWSNAPLIQAWSLSLEIVFYALVPFLVRLRTRTMAILALSSLGLKLAILVSPVGHLVFFKRFFPTEFWLFACGCLTYRLYRTLGPERRLSDLLAFGLLLTAIALADLVHDAAKPFFLPAVILMTMPFVFRWFQTFKLDRLTGKISYPFYLLHFTTIALFETFAEEPEGWTIMLIALAAAAFTHVLFEPGVERLKARFRSAPLVPARVAVPVLSNVDS